MTDHPDSTPLFANRAAVAVQLLGAGSPEPVIPAASAQPEPHLGHSEERMRLLRDHITRLDDELLAMIHRRTAVARQLGDARAEAGAPRFAHEEEIAVVRSFLQLGPAGKELAMILVRLGR